MPDREMTATELLAQRDKLQAERALEEGFNLLKKTFEQEPEIHLAFMEIMHDLNTSVREKHRANKDALAENLALTPIAMLPHEKGRLSSPIYSTPAGIKARASVLALHFMDNLYSVTHRWGIK